MRFLKVCFLFVIVCILSIGLAPDRAIAQTENPSTPGAVSNGGLSIYLPIVFSQPGHLFFGVEMGPEASLSNPGDPAERMSDAGASWVRLNGLLWSQVEPNPGNRYWSSKLEAQFTNVSKNRLRPILIIRSTPTWAQKVVGTYCGPIRADALDDFANFVYDVVARYSKPPYNVYYYELWNEPDVDAAYITGDNTFGCWGDGNDPYYGGRYYAEMLKYAYPAIKKANPNAQVLLGGLLLDCDPTNPPVGKDCKSSEFFEGVLINGGGNYLDGVNFHAYDYYPMPTNKNDPLNGLGRSANSNWHSAWNTTGPVMINKVNFLRNLLSQYGQSNKYLTNTEVAILCGDNQGSAEDYCAQEPVNYAFQNTKAYYVVQAYAVARWLNLRTNIWYSYYGWRDSGLYNSALQKVEAAYNAYDLANQHIDRARSAAKLSLGTDVMAYEFNHPDRRVWVMWYVGGDPLNGALTTNVTLPQAPQAIYRWINVGSGGTAPGTYQQDVLTQTLTVGRAPIFVVFP